MTTSPVWSLSLAIIFLFILLPAFSSSSCPSELQCNSTEPIEIRPPFFVGTPGLDPACRKSVNVSCGQLGPELDLATDSKLLLKEIQYDSHTVVVQDVQLSVSNNLSCSFSFNFMPPVDNFERSYPDLVRWFSSISCAHSNVTVFHSIFGDDKYSRRSTKAQSGMSAVLLHAMPLRDGDHSKKHGTSLLMAGSEPQKCVAGKPGQHGAEALRHGRTAGS
ncbi:putative receptor-like protein kinase [Panicum miliaceum]|uniref:Receptor-like protein kinase n=1 Tax=Panicum miliaceum TaxID=4540 RepID=A0A3L6SJ88_PANMI|nr:putative receptor-like protein kinase [Panicum miliaceum]